MIADDLRDHDFHRDHFRTDRSEHAPRSRVARVHGFVVLVVADDCHVGTSRLGIAGIRRACIRVVAVEGCSLTPIDLVAGIHRTGIGVCARQWSAGVASIEVIARLDAVAGIEITADQRCTRLADPSEARLDAVAGLQVIAF